MNYHKPASLLDIDFPRPATHLCLQAPLPNFLHTLPILVTIEGHGSGRQGPSPLAPPEEPANDKP